MASAAAVIEQVRLGHPRPARCKSVVPQDRAAGWFWRLAGTDFPESAAGSSPAAGRQCIGACSIGADLLAEPAGGVKALQTSGANHESPMRTGTLNIRFCGLIRTLAFISGAALIGLLGAIVVALTTLYQASTRLFVSTTSDPSVHSFSLICSFVQSLLLSIQIPVHSIPFIPSVRFG